jgi:hypothetical protein
MSEWPASVDEVLTGDQVVGFAYVTPLRGVVLQPLTNMGDPTEPVSSSVTMFKKLQRIEQNPQVAFAYHTRKHGFSDRPEYVLVHGRGSLTPVDDRDWVERHRENWERFAGPLPRNRFSRWLRREYHWRVGVRLELERVVVWPDLDCNGPASVYGTPLPDESPTSQRPPAKGTAPRVRHARAARRAARLPHVLLGWVGADGYPMVVPVKVDRADERGILIVAPRGLLPDGARRAGFVAHDFARYTAGQDLLKHTGWLEATGDGVAVYAPHTQTGYRMPRSETFFHISSGAVTKWRARRARREGFIS